MRVKAAALNKIGPPAPYARSRPPEILELDLAPPGRGEVLVRVQAAGLCHSDLSVIDGSRAGPVPLGRGAARGGGGSGARPGGGALPFRSFRHRRLAAAPRADGARARGGGNRRGAGRG